MTRAALWLALLCLPLMTAEAQPSTPGPSGAVGAPGEALARRITIQLRDVPLRDALDRVAILAGIRISYSGESLPLDRRVSLAREAATVADVLADLLQGFPVQPVEVGSDHVVLTPRESTPRDTAARGVAVLDRVIVTGSVVGASERPMPIALDVVRGRDAERRDESRLSSVLDGSVPGVWIWEQSPSSLVARYGSIRGASSFGLSFPKVYIDGIEVANPLLLTQISPELVERVEVIRGPQGAALYGSDAISGVVNIISRHEGASGDGTHATLRSEGGYSLSRFMPNAVPMQEHTLTIRRGSNGQSAGLSIGGATSGEFAPEAYSRELRAIGDVRRIGPRSTLTAGARYYAKSAGVATSPLLLSVAPDRTGADSEPQQLRLYSLGSTVTVVPNDLWTYAFTAGVDGYALSNVSNEQTPIPSVVDTALRDARGAATRGTLRLSAVQRRGGPGALASTLTVAVEQSVLRSRTLEELSLDSYYSGDDVVQRLVTGWSTNSGVTSQVDLAWRNSAFLTAGLRLELLDQLAAPMQTATLPMLGSAWVKDFSNATVKLRAAYGRGIRSPQSTLHLITREPRRTVANPGLAPESQSGVEAGTDIFLFKTFGLHLTRFDQRASGLIQAVTLGESSSGGGGSSNSGPGGGDSSTPRYWFQLQNVGEITNRGWEAQASAALGAFSLGAAATLVDSRVQRVAPGYSGDLRPGDRMLAVPAKTLSGTIGYAHRGLQLSSTISRATDWVNYDRLAVAEAWLASGGDGSALSGSKLRTFWATYHGATRLRASASYDVWRGVSISATGDNLLNYQVGEPDTVTIVPGRTISLGLKARF
ncbi:MAG TPA: TonB-dependent receptor [Gemmatimonadaceae bacterium]|nr:TonB-dependent receptor [Gemmatimonadaceae bacterium]